MQDANNQKLGVLEYCAAQKLGMPDMAPDTISGKVDWQQREIGKLLGRCKVDGIVLGRPRGVALKLGLDDQARKIDEYQALKLNKRAIAKLLGVSPNTLYAWLRRRRPETANAGEVADSG